MPDDMLDSIQNLVSEFNDLSLNDFRDAFQEIVKEKNPAVDRYLVTELENYRGNRTMRAVIALALAEREDESYLDSFARIIEKETDVGLCKECINGLVRIGTQEAIQKLEFLEKSKPNATIASLLRQEMDKLRHEEKEPIAYYLDHLADGNKNIRACIHAAKVLIKLGEPKVVEEIIAGFDEYDDLARAEGAKVISQLGHAEHMEAVLNIMDRYYEEYQKNGAFNATLESFDHSTKDQRLSLLFACTEEILSEEQRVFYEHFKASLEAHNMDQAATVKASLLDMGRPTGLAYYLQSLSLITDNKVAHATNFHDETLRLGRVRQSRLRHLIAQLGYGIGKISGQTNVEVAHRHRAVAWLTRLVGAQDGDISKLALYGTSFMVLPEDQGLLDALLKARQIEGMTRLINSLERKSEYDFTNFFLALAMNHEILDIQEMAMRAMGATEGVFSKLREMMTDPNAETRRMSIRIIGEIKAHTFIDDLHSLLEGQSDIIRIQAIQSLGKLGDPVALPRINEVMYDAKSPLLIETGLKAIANIGGPDAVKLLYSSAEKTRNRKTAVTAIGLLAGSFKSWSNPLPPDSHGLILNHLKTWMEERDPTIRKEAYQIGGSIITLDLDFYEKLKKLFKEVSTKLRGQTTWDKEEMGQVDKWVRALNRNYFFLKDMQEFQKTLTSICRGYDNPSSVARIQLFEKIGDLLEINDRFVLSEENEDMLVSLVTTGLDLGQDSWREQSLLFPIAAFSSSDNLKKTLCSRVKTVPKQAQAPLMDALTKMGVTLAEINDLTAIKKILVLDGSGFYRKRLVKFLLSKNFQVRDTDDLEVALAMIHSEAPHLILTEITFNQPYDGAAFAEQVSKTYGTLIQFIFSTNNREVSVLQRVGQLKPKRILFKPYPLDSLFETITT